MEDHEIFENSPSLEEFHGIEIVSQNSCARGKAFSILEDEAVCRAWLAVSQDPIIGNTQNKTTFWNRVHACKWVELRTQFNKPIVHTSSLSNPTTPASVDSDIEIEPSKGRLKRPSGRKAMKESQRKKVAHDARFDDMAANQTKIFEMLASMSSRSIEQDEQKAIDREMKAKNREPNYKC
ncbi:unnamed protein product [Ilex paraguariensis]|uniref:No apical meristem-associated C-terminal domain-containing protein n=1 Tax=Ilex paraguariensis TaxID=185542 RepID=A0ABC8SF73_9AQUA